jgi:hypothetical protein
MGQRRNARIATACACVTVALVASALVRRAGAGARSDDSDREAFLDDRRERMRVARLRLLAPMQGTAS